MIDNGIVLDVKDSFARVKVSPVEPCHDCSSRPLCAGHKDSDGILTVFNQVNAVPGDAVGLEIPETDYAKDLILIFGTLTLALTAGACAGYGLSSLVGLPAPALGLAGLLSGLLAGAIFLFSRFRDRPKNFRYPVIVEILNKGDFDG